MIGTPSASDGTLTTGTASSDSRNVGGVKDVAASVRARLTNEARRAGRPFQEVLTHFTLERFLYRLSRSPHAGRFPFEAATLGAALRATFARRDTILPADPTPLTTAFADDTARQAQWIAFLRRTGPPDAPQHFADVVTGLRAFLQPLIAALLQQGEATLGTWHPDHGWDGTGEGGGRIR